MTDLGLKSDEEVMLLYQAGDSRAFTTLFNRFERPVYGYIRSKLYQKELVEEVFQDCFMKLHRSRFLYDAKYPAKAFIFTIARTVLIDYYRKSGKTLSAPMERSDCNEQTSSMDDLDKAVMSLAPRERIAISGRYTDDKTFQELALLLDTNETNVRKIISRAMSKLKKILTRPTQTGGSKT